MARILLLLSFICLIAGCRGDLQGDRLFEVQYPVLNFPIPAGQVAFRSYTVQQNNLPTQFARAMADAGVDADDVDLVGGLRARVVSQTGDDFGEFDRIELRVCAVDQTVCEPGLSLLFSVDDLFRRRQLTVNLNPGLRNFRELFLNERMNVELVFFANNVTTVALDARLEWSVQAIGNLE